MEPSNDDLKNLYDALWKSEGGRRPPTSGAKPYTNLENLFEAYDYVDGGPRQGELSFTLKELQTSKVMLNNIAPYIFYNTVSIVPKLFFKVLGSVHT